jgi:hypothetical protein
MSDYDDEKQDEYISNSPRKMTDEEHEKLKNSLEDLLIPKISKTGGFFEGLVLGGILELISNPRTQTIEQNLFDSLLITGATFPLNKYILKIPIYDNYEVSPYIGAGALVGQTIVKYFKELN